MKCEEALQKIDAYINNTLTCKELEDFLIHIKNCPSCYDELEIYYTISAGVKYLEEEKPESYNIPQMLKADLKKKAAFVQRQHRIMGFLNFMGIIAGVLIGLFVLFQLGQIELPILF